MEFPELAVEDKCVCPVEDCCKEFAGSSQLTMHVRRHHEGCKLSLGETTTTTTVLHYCPVEDCSRAQGNSGQPFPRLGQLKQHYHSVHGAKEYSCDLCGRTFGLRDVFKRHQTECGSLIQCVTCKVSFRSKNALYQHAKRKNHQLPVGSKPRRPPANNRSKKSLDSSFTVSNNTILFPIIVKPLLKPHVTSTEAAVQTDPLPTPISTASQPSQFVPATISTASQASQLTHSLASTASQLTPNLASTASQASQLTPNLASTASQLTPNLASTASQFTHSLASTASQLTPNLASTASQASQFTHSLASTASQFTHSLASTASQASQLTQHTTEAGTQCTNQCSTYTDTAPQSSQHQFNSALIDANTLVDSSTQLPGLNSPFSEVMDASTNTSLLPYSMGYSSLEQLIDTSTNTLTASWADPLSRVDAGTSTLTSDLTASWADPLSRVDAGTSTLTSDLTASWADPLSRVDAGTSTLTSDLSVEDTVDLATQTHFDTLVCDLATQTELPSINLDSHYFGGYADFTAQCSSDFSSCFRTNDFAGGPDFDFSTTTATKSPTKDMATSTDISTSDYGVQTGNTELDEISQLLSSYGQDFGTQTIDPSCVLEVPQLSDFSMQTCQSGTDSYTQTSLLSESGTQTLFEWF